MMLGLPPRFAAAWAVAAVLAAAAPVRPAMAAPIQDYLALGDSMAFGETDWTKNPSYGDRGYVSQYANFLQTQENGVRPIVFNLGVDAETSTTFLHGGPQGNGQVSGQPAPQLNLNYHNPSTTQNALMLSTIAAEKAAGHDISTVSLQLGANDLLTVLNQPGFLSLSPQDQQAKIGAALGTLAANDATILTELKAQLPQANILLLGYPNPFNANPNSPVGMVADPAVKALNALIASEAASFGAKYVDAYTPIVGHELQYTHIASGNVHPNYLGYRAIADQMEQVPEPSSALVLGAAAAGWVAFFRRRRAAPPARGA